MISAHDLWLQAGGDTEAFSPERYRALMFEHGLLIPLKPGEKAEPLPCGWPAKRVADSPALAALPVQVARIVAVCKLSAQLIRNQPHWREGQAAFNALRQIDEECALAVTATAVDPFYDDSRLDAFWEFITEWTGEQAC